MTKYASTAVNSLLLCAVQTAVKRVVPRNLHMVVQPAVMQFMAAVTVQKESLVLAEEINHTTVAFPSGFTFL